MQKKKQKKKTTGKTPNMAKLSKMDVLLLNFEVPEIHENDFRAKL